MNTDHMFQIGRDHSVCEDYARSGVVKDDIAYAIVCDGCSSSPEVDLGARLLAMSAESNLLEYSKFGGLNYEEFGKTVIAKASGIFDIFTNLYYKALDATLVMAWVKDDVLTMRMYGDGVFIYKSKSHITTIHVDYSNNAPSYLSYQLDDGRMKNYLNDGGAKHIKDSEIADTIVCLDPFSPVEFKSPVDKGDIILVCSDGINSFKKADGTPIDWKELVKEFSGFKTTPGEFIDRRMKAFKRQCIKDGTYHYDDISIAGICV